MIDRVWRIIYTRRNKEKKVAGILAKKKIKTFVPLSECECIAEGRKKIIEGPLFPGYVFVCDEGEPLLKLSKDIINYVYWKNSPAIIQNDEINALKIFLKEYSCLRVEKAFVLPDSQYKIDNELQVRRKGNLVEANIATVKLTLPSLGRVLVAEIRKEKAEEFMYAKGSIFKSTIDS